MQLGFVKRASGGGGGVRVGVCVQVAVLTVSTEAKHKTVQPEPPCATSPPYAIFCTKYDERNSTQSEYALRKRLARAGAETGESAGVHGW